MYFKYSNQKYQNFEVIFFDNFSSDRSKEIIQSFGNSKIKYFYTSMKLPLYKARNEAIKMFRELIVF